jgi:hypothetical protein
MAALPGSVGFATLAIAFLGAVVLIAINAYDSYRTNLLVDLVKQIDQDLAA